MSEPKPCYYVLNQAAYHVQAKRVHMRNKAALVKLLARTHYETVLCA